jgi:hypothetical protein
MLPCAPKKKCIVKRTDTHSLDFSTRWTIPGDAVIATQVDGRYKVWCRVRLGAPRVADFAGVSEGEEIMACKILRRLHPRDI